MIWDIIFFVPIMAMFASTMVVAFIGLVIIEIFGGK